MGTYDLIVEYSIGSYFDRVTQSKVPINDTAYWGMMASNYSRNMTFKSCSISRFDAHCGFWNADLIDCEIGQSINVIGGGKLNIIRTKRYGVNFIALSNDYGATFEGEILIQDCDFLAERGYSSDTKEGGDKYVAGNLYDAAYIIKADVKNYTVDNRPEPTEDYTLWDFGYKCYMPSKVIIDNLKTHTNTYVFNDIHDAHFIPQAEGDEIYEPTKEIVFRNMTQSAIDAIPNCRTPANSPMVAAFKRTVQNLKTG